MLKEETFANNALTRNGNGTLGHKWTAGGVILRYINIQGLSEIKMSELESMMKDNKEIMLLTETHLRGDHLRVGDGYEYRMINRNTGDKKGGGLMMFHRKNSKIEYEIKDVNCKDVMMIEASIYDRNMKIILVYFSVNGGPEDRKRNEEMRKKRDG